ncbi:hypothetical protein DFH06DRAFT_1293700 [Mycena polygramma]|nr:hypothetical protein DFH06DRAFT_1293700 [Mycena polygramma]
MYRYRCLGNSKTLRRKLPLIICMGSALVPCASKLVFTAASIMIIGGFGGAKKKKHSTRKYSADSNSSTYSLGGIWFLQSRPPIICHNSPSGGVLLCCAARYKNRARGHTPFPPNIDMASKIPITCFSLPPTLLGGDGTAEHWQHKGIGEWLLRKNHKEIATITQTEEYLHVSRYLLDATLRKRKSKFRGDLDIGVHLHARRSVIEGGANEWEVKLSSVRVSSKWFPAQELENTLPKMWSVLAVADAVAKKEYEEWDKCPRSESNSD